MRSRLRDPFLTSLRDARSVAQLGRALALVLASLSAAACGASASAPDLTCGGAAPYAARGPFEVGVVTLTRGSTTVEVWYPASRGGARDVYDLRDWLPSEIREKLSAVDETTFETDAVRDAPLASGGSLPIALFSHGLAAYRSQSSFLTTHLASWGFVVAAPDHPERGLARLLSNQPPVFSRGADALREALAITQADPRFAERLDRTKLVALGHSAGGGTAGILARDDDVRAWVAMAAGSFSGVPAKTAMLIGGERDDIVPASAVRDGYGDLPSPGRYLRVLRGAGHLAFSDICLIARDRGGIVQLAIDEGVEVSELLATLAVDGCRPGDLPAERAWPAIRHYTTAALRAGAGVDPAPAGLDAAADACFENLVVEARQD